MDAARSWRARHRYYRQLYPLWADLTEAIPDLMLTGGSQERRVPIQELGFALQRRIVEICDARLALRDYTDRSVTEAAIRCGLDTNLIGRHLDIAVEAARIRAGLRAPRAGHLAERVDENAPYDPPGDYDEQIAWLAQVSHAYQNQRTAPLGEAAGTETAPANA